MTAQLLAGTGTFRFSLLKTLTQLFIQVAVTVEHAGRINIAKVCATLHHFGHGKGLLASITLHLLRLLIIQLQLFVLLRIALQHRNQRFQFRQLCAMLLQETRGFLCFIQALKQFVITILQGFILQQADAWHQAVKLGDALFRLVKLLTLLLVFRFMRGLSTLEFTATQIQQTQFRFRI